MISQRSSLKDSINLKSFQSLSGSGCEVKSALSLKFLWTFGFDWAHLNTLLQRQINSAHNIKRTSKDVLFICRFFY